MKKSIIILLTLVLSIDLLAQSSCYQSLKQEGLDLYRNRQYELAINKFLSALSCDSFNQRELASLIKRAQRARENELIQERNASQANALRAQSIIALKQENNPSKACLLALEAIQMVPGDIKVKSAFIDAWYSQVFLWKGRYYAVPMARVFQQTGVLGNAALSPDDLIFVTASWDPPIVKLWPVQAGETISLIGYGGPIWRLHYSGKGNQLAVASLDGTVRLYSNDGMLLHRLTEHKGPVYDVRFSSKNDFLVSASQDGTAKVWKVDTGQRIFQLDDKSGSPIKTAVFSPDDSMVLTAHENGNALMWDIERNQSFELNHGYHPLKMAFFLKDSTNRTRIVTVGEEGGVKIWKEKELVGEVVINNGVGAIAPHTKGSTLVIGSRDGRVIFSDLNGKITHNFQAHSDQINGIVFSPDSLYFLTFSSDNTIKIWTDRGNPVLALGEFTGPVLSAGFSSDGNIVFGSSWDGSARLFDLTSHPVESYQNLGGNIQRVIISPDEKKIISVSLNGRAMAWETDSGGFIQCSPNSGWLHDVVINKIGDQVAISADSGVIIWNLKQNSFKKLPHNGANSARFFTNGTILTGASDGSMKCWTAAGGHLFDLGVDEENDALSSLDISSDGEFVAAGHQNGTVSLWSVSKKSALWRKQYHTSEKVYSVSLSPKGKYMVSAGGDNRAFLWNLKGDPVNLFKHSGPVTNAGISSDGAWVLSNSVDGTTKLWRIESDTATTTLRMPTAINFAVLSPDGQLIATASNDGIIRLWSREGELLARIPASSRSVNWISFFPKSDRLVSASSDGRIHVWELNPRKHLEGLPETGKY